MTLPPLPYPADPRSTPPGPIHGAVIYQTPDPILAPADDDDSVNVTPGPPTSLLPPPPAE